MLALPKFHPQNRRQVLAILTVTLLLILIGSLTAVFGPPFLPLWYSLTVSEEQLTPSLWVLAIPGLAAAIAAASLWFGRQTQLEHESYLATISLGSGLSLLLLLLIAFLRILWVVL